MTYDRTNGGGRQNGRMMDSTDRTGIAQDRTYGRIE